MKIVLAIFIYIFTFNVSAQDLVPNKFIDGTPALADEVNQNFTSLADSINENKNTINSNKKELSSDISDTDSRIDGVIDYFLQRTLFIRRVSKNSNFNEESWAGSELIEASCPDGTTITGGGVTCYGVETDLDTVNVGTVYISNMAGNSWFGACLSDPEANVVKSGPGIIVNAVCTSIESAIENAEEKYIGSLVNDSLATESKMNKEAIEMYKSLKKMHDSAIKSLENE